MNEINDLHAISRSQNTRLTSWTRVWLSKLRTRHMNIIHFNIWRHVSSFTNNSDCYVSLMLSAFSFQFLLGEMTVCFLILLTLSHPSIPRCLLTRFQENPHSDDCSEKHGPDMSRLINTAGSKNCNVLFKPIPSRQSIVRILVVTHAD